MLQLIQIILFCNDVKVCVGGKCERKVWEETIVPRGNTTNHYITISKAMFEFFEAENWWS